MRERNDSRYEQFETSPETIKQELRPAVCERRHTGGQTDGCNENYNIDFGAKCVKLGQCFDLFLWSLNTKVNLILRINLIPGPMNVYFLMFILFLFLTINCNKKYIRLE